MKTNKFFRSLILIFGCLFTICPNGEIDLGTADQTRFDFNLFRNDTQEPNDLAPQEAIDNPYSDTIFIKDYFAPYYFSHLKNRFGNNVKGSCSYVAAEMLLSYYDCFWNDAFLPEKYDGEKVLINETILDAPESPGSKNEEKEEIEHKYLTDKQYYDQIRDYSHEILHFDLMSIGLELYDKYNDETGVLSLGTSLLRMQEVVSTYLDRSTPLGRNSISIGFQNSDPDLMRQTIVEKVTQGIPIIIDAGKPGGYAHSFIAYDYDSENDEIYCNAGFYDDTTCHVGMTNLGYTNIQEILFFEPTIEHEHSFNYCQIDDNGNEVGVCACSSMAPTEIEITDNYLDVSPTYKWNSLIKEKWSEKDGIHHKLSILQPNRLKAYEVDQIFNNQFTLNSLVWKNIINTITAPYYYVYITLDSDTSPYLDDYYCEKLFKEPNRYKKSASFLPQDWGFEGRYWFSNEGDNGEEYKGTILSVKGLTITARRLRCGYVENQYINLSPRRQGAGEAYLMLTWDKPVYSYMFGASFWSNGEILNGAAYVPVKHSPLDENSWSSEADADFNLKKLACRRLEQT